MCVTSLCAQCVMARQMKFVADRLITECADEAFDMVALPGGMPGRCTRPLLSR